MKFSRDTLRTILALLLIIIIVVATFAYGNAQRNKQKADNAAKTTETQSKTNDTEKSATVDSGTNSNSSTNNSSTTTNPSTTNTTTTVTPDTGGSAQVQPTTMPETGTETAYVVPLAIVALAGYFYLRSRQRLAFSQSKI